MQTYTFELGAARVTVELPDSVPAESIVVDVWAHLSAHQASPDMFVEVMRDLGPEHFPDLANGAKDVVRATTRHDSGARVDLHVSVPATQPKPKPLPEWREALVSEAFS